ncbi:hypothetical protein NC99_02710 [Sunxiuqinia dokdonensis]|uniref:Uncharacterized protein n=1 Tax=Sunxiuqinia dokdonensis TaxID=1409788 RepID=A0A0L8VEI4_9BACT|nr:hypothetical protein NC99_02710 [Sunxiuqinia dokdonensis]
MNILNSLFASNCLKANSKPSNTIHNGMKKSYPICQRKIENNKHTTA